MARLIQPENELEQLRALASDFQRLPDSMTDMLCHFSASAEKTKRRRFCSIMRRN